MAECKHAFAYENGVYCRVCKKKFTAAEYWQEIGKKTAKKPKDPKPEPDKEAQTGE